MFEVTQTAQEHIAEYFKTNEIAPIRIYLNTCGCSTNPYLSLALDDAKQTDELFEIGGYQYIIDKPLFEYVKPVKVDFIEDGFIVGCNVMFGGCNSESSCDCSSSSESSCGGSCSGCS